MYDGASLGYTAGLEQLAQDFDMQQPSANKWATPIVGSRKASYDDSSSENIKSKLSKYDPCVSFAAGAPILRQDVKYSLFVNPNQNNSSSSSGKSTPGARSSGGATPPHKVSKKIDPCVTFIAGKPILTPPSEDEENERSALSRGGVNPITLKKALKQSFPDEQNHDENAAKKGLVIIKQHFDKDELDIASAAPSDRGRFINVDNNKKSSAISVLREDFRVPVTKSGARTAQQGVVTREVGRDPTFHLSVSLAENDHSTPPQATLTYSRDMIARGQRGKATGNLTSLTSQATLVESRSNEKSTFDRNQPARRGIRNNSRDIQVRKDSQTDDKNNKIGFVVATKQRTGNNHKISSSSDLSDEDSAVENGKDVVSLICCFDKEI